MIVEEAVDKIDIGDETREHLAKVILFASKNTNRMRSFMQTFDYALNWGRGRDRDNPTVVSICPDFAPYSFIFNIWCYRYDMANGVLTKDDRPFTMGMIYDASRNVWSTHS
jgi:hypothetical protein